jgi:hypothetical protein
MTSVVVDVSSRFTFNQLQCKASIFAQSGSSGIRPPYGEAGLLFAQSPTIGNCCEMHVVADNNINVREREREQVSWQPQRISNEDSGVGHPGRRLRICRRYETAVGASLPRRGGRMWIQARTRMFVPPRNALPRRADHVFAPKMDGKRKTSAIYLRILTMSNLLK